MVTIRKKASRNMRGAFSLYVHALTQVLYYIMAAGCAAVVAVVHIRVASPLGSPMPAKKCHRWPVGHN